MDVAVQTPVLKEEAILLLALEVVSNKEVALTRYYLVCITSW